MSDSQPSDFQTEIGNSPLGLPSTAMPVFICGYQGVGLTDRVGTPVGEERVQTGPQQPC